MHNLWGTEAADSGLKVKQREDQTHGEQVCEVDDHLVLDGRILFYLFNVEQWTIKWPVKD